MHEPSTLYFTSDYPRYIQLDLNMNEEGDWAGAYQGPADDDLEAQAASEEDYSDNFALETEVSANSSSN